MIIIIFTDRLSKVVRRIRPSLSYSHTIVSVCRSKHCHHHGLVINILLKGFTIAVIVVIMIIVIIFSIIIINVVRLSLNREDSQDVTDDHRNEMLSR